MDASFDRFGLPYTEGGLVGLRYTDRGRSPEEGFDCWGLALWVYRELGIPVPDQSLGWRRYFDFLPADVAIQPGDVLGMVGLLGLIDHVAIAVSPSELIHADHKFGSVVREPIRRHHENIKRVARLRDNRT